mmetsp:Transcript_46563/g.146005  ORF Transcript_46563/g.146005 Transcript_46563/m.146005 type:complete len:115 (+) Transcript_46563:173-517(+)
MKSSQALLSSLDHMPDIYRPGDPVKEEVFRDNFLHVDGTINEKVLLLLQKYVPISSGALPASAGFLIFICFVIGIVYSWMHKNRCWEVRDTEYTRHVCETRRLRSIQKYEENQV